MHTRVTSSYPIQRSTLWYTIVGIIFSMVVSIALLRGYVIIALIVCIFAVGYIIMNIIRGSSLLFAVKEDRIQDNAINDISNIQGQYASQYRITNSLDAIRLQITPYIQWTMYLGLSIAVILIVYNGFLMVTNSINGGAGDTSKVKTNLINITVGVILLCGFYIIIEVGISIIEYVAA